MSTYSIIPSRLHVAGIDALHLALSFGEPAGNDVIVREVEARMRELKQGEVTGGRLILLDGPASLPVITAITHHAAHLFGAVAVYDPKLRAYVVAISHDPAFAVGDIVHADGSANGNRSTAETTS
jgi:CRISPR-associated protein Csx3